MLVAGKALARQLGLARGAVGVFRRLLLGRMLVLGLVIAFHGCLVHGVQVNLVLAPRQLLRCACLVGLAGRLGLLLGQGAALLTWRALVAGRFRRPCSGPGPGP